MLSHVLRYLSLALAVSLSIFPSGAHAQSCHGLADEPGGGLTATVLLEAANYDRGQEGSGNYQGISARLTLRPGRFGGRLVLPMYRVADQGHHATVGLGDVFASVDAGLLGGAGGPMEVGVSFGGTAPTGSRQRGLGMGHVMLMPSVWIAAGRGDWRARAEAGYGHALGTEAGAHHHGSSPATLLVNPMNSREITGALWSDLRLLRWLAPAASVTGGAPIGDGRARVVAAAELRFLRGGWEPWVAVQAPVVGDPFGLRLLLALSFRS